MQIKITLLISIVLLSLSANLCQGHQSAFHGFGMDQPIVNLKQLGRITHGQVKNRLWSDDYWAKYAGGLAYRYAEPGFWLDINNPKPNDWKVPGLHILRNRPAAALIREGKVNALSPAEKYDLLVGDSGYSLTRAFIQEINHRTEPWEGSCDGWAYAAYNEAPPVKAVNVQNLAGQAITFYPSDIRALLTLLYSGYRVSSFGDKCHSPKPATDAQGRLVDTNCRDTSPADFHTVLINQVGIGQRGFSVDTDYAKEVWNQPVKSFKLKYFNPQTFAVHANGYDAKIHKSQFSRDRFAAHRDARGTHIVGVDVDVQYQMEAFPKVTHHLSPSHEKVASTSYRYDLEIDAQGNIIGGEWDISAQRNHPDLITYVATHNLVLSQFDRHIRGNNLTQVLQSLRPHFAKQASARKRPLFKVVKALARMSQ
ncbi:MAG: hypothetical protein ACPG47_02600 [Leucothrix sp.]